MHRSRLLSLLARYQPPSTTERNALERTRLFVSLHVDCFERTLTVGHVTGSAWILDESRTHVLLAHHRKLDRWLQLGGHADGEPNVALVAEREAVEESGLSVVRPAGRGIFDLDVHEIPAYGSDPAHLHYDVRFLFEADRRAPLVVSGESKDLAWVPLDDVGRLADDESVLRMARKTLLASRPNAK